MGDHVLVFSVNLDIENVGEFLDMDGSDNVNGGDDDDEQSIGIGVE